MHETLNTDSEIVVFGATASSLRAHEHAPLEGMAESKKIFGTRHRVPNQSDMHRFRGALVVL